MALEVPRKIARRYLGPPGVALKALEHLSIALENIESFQPGSLESGWGKRSRALETLA